MKKRIIYFVFGALIFGTIGAVTAGTISASTIAYKNTTVDVAIDDLYNKATEVITDLESQNDALTTANASLTSNNQTLTQQNEALTQENQSLNAQLVTSNELTPVLLWTNPSPTSNFTAQTISLNLSQYKYVIVVIKSSTTENRLPRTNIILPVTNNYESAYEPSIGTNGSLNVRLIKATSTGVWIAKATNSAGAINNNLIIPYKIYGVKNNLNIDLGIE